MDTRTERSILHHIEREWRSLSADFRPWGIWLTLHGAPPEEVDTLDRERSPAQRAWFLDENGVQHRDVWAFMRVWVVHLLQPWCKRPFRESDAMFASHRHFIGLAAFAACEETDNVYFEVVFGGLSERGCRLVMGECGAVREVELWRS
jgi:hypothetical protein